MLRFRVRVWISYLFRDIIISFARIPGNLRIVTSSFRCNFWQCLAHVALCRTMQWRWIPHDGSTDCVHLALPSRGARGRTHDASITLSTFMMSFAARHGENRHSTPRNDARYKQLFVSTLAKARGLPMGMGIPMGIPTGKPHLIGFYHTDGFAHRQL